MSTNNGSWRQREESVVNAKPVSDYRWTKKRNQRIVIVRMNINESYVISNYFSLIGDQPKITEIFENLLKELVVHQKP